jgi:predicted Zn finger-like uncharacterized protein
MRLCARARRSAQPLLAERRAAVDMKHMRIACPSCGAEYDVPDRLLSGAARTLRCSRCATDFALPTLAPVAQPAPPPPAPPEMVAAPAPEPSPPVAAPEPEAPHAPAVPERTPVARDPRDRALVGAWVASVLVVLGGVAAMLAFRAQLMAAWPPVTRFFSALGLA